MTRPARKNCLTLRLTSDRCVHWLCAEHTRACTHTHTHTCVHMCKLNLSMLRLANKAVVWFMGLEEHCEPALVFTDVGYSNKLLLEVA